VGLGVGAMGISSLVHKWVTIFIEVYKDLEKSYKIDIV
jgi:hypothetical protein